MKSLIANRRKELGYSRSDLAMLMLVSIETVKGWESGALKPGYYESRKLARILECNELKRPREYKQDKLMLYAKAARERGESYGQFMINTTEEERNAMR